MFSLNTAPTRSSWRSRSHADECLTKAVAQASQGYVYVTSRAGVTGASETISAQIGRHLPTLAAYGAPPAVLGFGISRHDQVRAAAAAGFDGVIIGSAMVQRVADNLDDRAQMRRAVAQMMREMMPATIRRSP